MRCGILIGGVFLFFPPPARAESSCSSYLNTKVSAVSPEVALQKFRKVPQKSEYETTAQYQSRVSAVVGENQGPIVVRIDEADKLYLEYEADAGKLRVSRGLFGSPFDAFRTFISGSYWDLLQPGIRNNVGTVLAERERVTGSYAAQNGFGVKTTVRRITTTTTAIYDKAGTWFPNIAGRPTVVGEISVSPLKARALKSSSIVALVAEPRPPYIVTGSRLAESPSLDRPRRVTENFTVLIADISCGLLVEPDGNVIGSFLAQ